MTRAANVTAAAAASLREVCVMVSFSRVSAIESGTFRDNDSFMLLTHEPRNCCESTFSDQSSGYGLGGNGDEWCCTMRQPFAVLTMAKLYLDG